MKKILIARAELSTRMAASKGDEPSRQVIPAGTHLTEALLKKHGLKDNDVEALLARGHIVERSAHVVTEGDGPTAAELKAANKRADDAEAKVKELTEELAEANAERDELTVKLDAARALLTPEQLKTLDEPAQA